MLRCDGVFVLQYCVKGLHFLRFVCFILSTQRISTETRTVGSSGVYLLRKGCFCLVSYTGFGKSICYQALPYMFDHKLGRSNVGCKSVVLVVSPLLSLRVDQVTSLRSAGVGATILRSAGFPCGGPLTDKLLVDERDIERGKFSLLFGTTKAIVESERWRELLLGDLLHQQVAVDEAHCVHKINGKKDKYIISYNFYYHVPLIRI